MNTPQTELDVYIEMSRLADLWIDGQIIARDYYGPVKALKALAAEFKKARAIVKAHQPDGGEAERMEARHMAHVFAVMEVA